MPATARVRSLALPAALLTTASLLLAGPAPVSAAPAGSTAVVRDAVDARRTAPPAGNEERILAALRTARGQVGDPYSYGAAGPGSFDCSGLVYYSYRRAGVPVPRTSSAQAGATRRISRSQLRPGDLMFFTGSGGVYHVGIFVGWKGGRALMLHSPNSGERVQYSAPFSDSWFAGTLRTAPVGVKHSNATGRAPIGS